MILTWSEACERCIPNHILQLADVMQEYRLATLFNLVMIFEVKFLRRI